MKDQIKEGIDAGYKEIKNSTRPSYALSWSFLLLLIPRLVQISFKEVGVDINSEDIYHNSDTGDKVEEAKELEWGCYKSKDRANWTEAQATWYEWLKVDSASLAHWYQQIGLCRGAVLRDLKTLSKEVYSPDSKRQPDSKSRLRDFYDKYTVFLLRTVRSSVFFLQHRVSLSLLTGLSVKCMIHKSLPGILTRR